LSGSAETLHALAGSVTLQGGDLASFYQTALNATAGSGSALSLRTLDGQQTVNTRRPYAMPLPKANEDMLRLRQAMGPNPPLVTNLFLAPLSRQHEFAVEVPVMRNGAVTSYLARQTPASALLPLLTKQSFPASWRLAVIDRNGIVVARSNGHESFVGRRADQTLLAKIAAAPSGVNEGKTLDGIAVKAFFHRAPWSGWTVVLSVPVAELYAPARMAALLLAGLIIVLVAGAALAARRVSRQIARPVQQLHQAAVRLGEGAPVRYGAAGLAEIDAVGVAMVAAAEKITSSQEQLENRVRQAVAQTEQAQQAMQRAQKLEALGRLTGGVAHDFNNVLQTLTSALDLVRRDPNPAQLERRIAVCDQAVQRAGALVAQLRSFGQVQDATLREVDIAQALAVATPLLRNAVAQHAALTVDAEPRLGNALLDVVQFDMALLNLVINARDAVPSGGRIAVRAVLEPDGKTIRIEVSDNGSGMPPEVAKRASEPFYTTKSNGMGLGLAQVFSFVQQCGGRVDIESKHGEGTTVALLLPRGAGQDGPEVPAESMPAEVPVERSILVVDDEQLIRDTTSAMLQHLGWTVRTAENAEQALAALAGTDRFSALLSDVVMPGKMNGIDLAREARHRWPQLPIVLATAYAHERIDIPGVEVLAKPYRMQNVMEAIELSRRQLAAIGAAALPHV
jgi:signal transduction histidine kinase/CheY-like chemotaxis protein